MEGLKGEIVIYREKGNNIRLEVTLEQEMVWLTQKQMADLFGKDIRTINEHIRNIFKEGELKKHSVIRNSRITATDGKTYETNFYSLDVIISVGYRVKSRIGTSFRIWATSIIKKHLIEGFTLNEKRLQTAAAKYHELKKAVSLIGNVLQVDDLPSEARGMAEVISSYARALDIIDDFDHNRLAIPGGTKSARYTITYEKAQEIIGALKTNFSGSQLVGLEKDPGLKGSLGAIYQTVNGRDVYATVEEKAAHLLYFVTKNHSFVDGNKRIAAALFVCYLGENGLLYDKAGRMRIDTNALIALTIMTAASKPEEKETMIRVILNLLA